MEIIEKQPKVFISYSWDGQARQDQIIELVQRLAADGVDTIVDIYDLKEGDDKNHFMEKMVTDETVSHVLIICDKKYSEKANKRKSGVGTESQIISQEVYNRVSQSKFIPLVYEFNDDTEACTPVFFKSRIYIDFSSPEKENENWERLIRLLHGKPELIKPEVSKRPSYLDVKQTKNTYEMDSKFRVFKNALLSEKITTSLYRDDLLDSCFNFADSLRVRSASNEADFPQKVIDDFKQLVNVRNILVDWCLLESRFEKPDFSESLLNVLKRLLEMASRPIEVDSWSEDDFHAHKAFAYETFLYILAALIKNEKFLLANEVLKTHYELPETSLSNDYQFCSFDEFYFHSDLLQSKLSPPKMILNSAVAELLKINAE
ncbi:SEFIR domain-containing protein [Rahnella sp. PAMC 25559]|uniref:SEFIR domain-containing protein n=1 Tax=Rahnella sp. PAMC 25559 TaxID=3423225 RepID=UPI003D671024